MSHLTKAIWRTPLALSSVTKVSSVVALTVLRRICSPKAAARTVLCWASRAGGGLVKIDRANLIADGLGVEDGAVEF